MTAEQEIKGRERTEQLANALGDTLKSICDDFNEQFDDLPNIGFGLTLFSFGEGGFMVYASNGNREDMIEAMKELVERLEAADDG